MMILKLYKIAKWILIVGSYTGWGNSCEYIKHSVYSCTITY